MINKYEINDTGKKATQLSLKINTTYTIDSSGNSSFNIVTNAPMRIDKEQTAEILGVQTRDLVALHHTGILLPLGHKLSDKKLKVQSSTRFYALIDVCNLASDAQMMHNMQHAISEYNKTHNGRVKIVDVANN